MCASSLSLSSSRITAKFLKTHTCTHTRTHTQEVIYSHILQSYLEYIVTDRQRSHILFIQNNDPAVSCVSPDDLYFSLQSSSYNHKLNPSRLCATEKYNVLAYTAGQYFLLF